MDRLPPASPALFLFFSFLTASSSTSFVLCTFRVSYSHRLLSSFPLLLLICLQSVVAHYQPASCWPAALKVAIVVNLGLDRSDMETFYLMPRMFNLAKIIHQIPFLMQTSPFIQAWGWLIFFVFVKKISIKKAHPDPRNTLLANQNH